MSGIVFANTQAQGTQSGDETQITSGEFWPVIDINHLRQVMRIDNNATSARVYHTATEAVAHVNSQLRGYRLAATQSGITHLSNTTEETINSQSVQTTRYTRAVYCYTKALLLEKYADTDATGKTGTRAEAKQEQAEDYRRDAHFAVADILGRRRCDDALI